MNLPHAWGTNALRVHPFRLAPAVLCLLVAVSAFARSPQPPPEQPAAPPSANAAADRQPAPAGKTHTQRRPALLREGSHLFRVPGRAVLHEPSGTWEYVIESDDPESPGHRLTIMPGTLLDELERMIESAPRQQLLFQVSGSLYVYRGRNFLMMSHPALLIDHLSPSPPTPPAPPADRQPQNASAADIIRQLDSSVGPVARRPELSEPSPLAANLAAAPAENLLREGATLLSRRGKIRRTEAGAFIFVLDADAEGLGDPPLILLPCLLLERIERHVRRAGVEAPALLSGHVYTYRGCNYLLPTVYRVPREQTMLAP